MLLYTVNSLKHISTANAIDLLLFSNFWRTFFFATSLARAGNSGFGVRLAGRWFFQASVFQLSICCGLDKHSWADFCYLQLYNKSGQQFRGWTLEMSPVTKPCTLYASFFLRQNIFWATFFKQAFCCVWATVPWRIFCSKKAKKNLQYNRGFGVRLAWRKINQLQLSFSSGSGGRLTI